MISFFQFLLALARSMFSSPWYGEECLRLMHLLARRCLIPVSLAVAPVGGVIAFQGLEIFRLFGAERLLSAFLGSAVIREYSPALASVMVAAQAGSSIAARIGTMQVRSQIDALRVMAVDPIRYLVVPGVVACTLVTPMLSMLTHAVGLASGWFFAVVLGGVDAGSFRDQLFSQVQLGDLWVGMLKCLVFGLSIGVIAGYRGLQVGKDGKQASAAEVGRAANDTVVATIVLILAMDYLLSTLWLDLYGKGAGV